MNKIVLINGTIWVLFLMSINVVLAIKGVYDSASMTGTTLFALIQVGILLGSITSIMYLRNKQKKGEPT